MRKVAAMYLMAALLMSGAVYSVPEDIRLYFTSPGKNGHHGPEDGLARLIDGAEISFYGAFYELSSQRIIRKLIEARLRGVDVRLVVEGDNSVGQGIQALRAAGIPVVADDGPGLMHNKFAVVDGIIVWTGSYNVTRRGGTVNDNNAIEVRSRELARYYLDEFREMHQRGIFGNRREPGVFAPLGRRGSVIAGSARISVYFAPEDRVERVIRGLLRSARSSVRFMAFTFTSNSLGNELVSLHRRGVAVAGVIEGRGARAAHSEYLKFRVEGIDVKRDGNENTMHHKVIIIDGRIVIMGSYNFTGSADRRNDENILVIECPEIAEEFLREFRRVSSAGSS